VLYGVAASGPSDVWAVGSGQVDNAHGQLIMHWDGTRWSVVPGKSIPAWNYANLSSVSVRASNDVWVVGSGAPLNKTESDMLIEHWDGATWSTAQTPRPGLVNNELHGVVAVSSTDVWAVGVYGQDEASQALLMRYTG
jgi:hypothetical protein